MAKKLKRAIKKAAKVALPMLAIAGLGKAFMNNRAKNFTNADAIKALTSNKAMRGTQIPMGPTELSDEIMSFDESMPFGMGVAAKKGGRIVKGKKVAVRTKGFGKKKKQANRSKKK